MPALARRLLAEFLGTFGFVYFGCAAVVVNAYPSAGIGLVGIALVHGLALSIFVSMMLPISGGLLNPALTVGLLVTRRLDPVAALGYIVAQLAGAVLGALAVKMMFPTGVGRVIAYGTPMIGSSVTLTQAIGIEALLTFFLMSAVFGTALSAVAPKVAGFGIGLTVFLGVMVAAPLTGPGINPARAFGPALVSGVWTGHAAYWIGPIIGAIIAAVIWDRLLTPREVVVVV